MPPTGVIFSNIDAPSSLSLGGQDLGTRRGEASCASLLGLFAWGDCGAKAAADVGAINELKQLEYNFFNFLFVRQSLATIAYGD